MEESLLARKSWLCRDFFVRMLCVVKSGKDVDIMDMNRYNEYKYFPKGWVPHMDNRSIFRKFADWLTTGGVMKAIGRVITLVGIIVALAVTGVGVVDMYKEAEAARDVAYEKAYVKQQKKEYKAAQKANTEAEKNGEALPYPDLPATQEEWEVVELPVVKLNFDDHIGGFITGYVGWAVLALIAGIFLGWCIGSIPEWIVSMKAAGPVRVIAGAFFWGGVVVAACFVGAGLWKILKINKSTLPEVGKILFDGYVFWAVAALGCGFGIQQIMNKGPKTHEAVFESPKSNAAFKWLYLIVLFLAPFAVAACLMAAIRMGWVTGLIGLIVVGVILLAAWLLSGVCPLVRTKEEIAAEKARRDRTSWVCPVCGRENARSTGECEACGAVKPVQ